MELIYETLHVLQDVVFFFTGAVWGRTTLAFSHAHSSPGGMKSHT